VRGSGTNSDGTVAGAFGAKQGMTVQRHDHASVNIASVTGGPSAIFAFNGAIVDHPTATTTETRPKNIAMLYCIKF
jgi:hypothetical protein